MTNVHKLTAGVNPEGPSTLLLFSVTSLPNTLNNYTAMPVVYTQLPTQLTSWTPFTGYFTDHQFTQCSTTMTMLSSQLDS